MSFAMREVLQREKKNKLLVERERDLTGKIERLNNEINSKEQEITDTQNQFEEMLIENRIDHEETVKNLKQSIEQKKSKLKDILTTPKQIIVQKK